MPIPPPLRQAPFFLTQRLERCSTSTILEAMKRLFRLPDLKMKHFRRQVVDYVHSHYDLEARFMVSQRMCHSLQVAERYYMKEPSLRNLSKASSLIAESFSAANKN